jgi:hypothetical protein
MRIRPISSDREDATVASLLHRLARLFCLVKWPFVALLHRFVGTRREATKGDPYLPPPGTGTPGTGAKGVPFGFWPGVARARHLG